MGKGDPPTLVAAGDPPKTGALNKRDAILNRRMGGSLGTAKRTAVQGERGRMGAWGGEQMGKRKGDRGRGRERERKREGERD